MFILRKKMFKIVLQGVLCFAMTLTMTIDKRSAHVGLGTCFVCVQELTFSNCLQNTTMCQPNEVCFTSENVDENGTVRYNAGCLSEQICRMVTGQDIETTTAPIENGNLIGRKRNIPSNCFTCCSTDTGANRPCNDHRCPTGLGHVAASSTSIAQSNCIEGGNCQQHADFFCSPSNPSGMDICPITCKKPSCVGHVGLGTCFVCVQEVTFSNCLQNTTMCQPNEVCFTSENVDENGTVRYNAGCLSEQICRMVTGQDIETTTAPIQNGNLIGRRSNIPSNCFTCCSTDTGANRPCNDYRCPTGLGHVAASSTSSITFVHGECKGDNNHCHHVCLSTGKYNCITNHGSNHGCECLPHDYCDDRYNCKSTDVVCSHNEAIRCNGNNKCECYCSQDSQCHNCPAGTLGFCVNEKCVCESNNYCPGGNKFYCLRNFQCAHNESKRCNQNDRCECFCNIDTDCKNCPQKGFCVDGTCVCESQNYCPKGNHMYCLSLSCDRGYTSKCNSTNHCYCAYVPDTCSNHDVSKCYHLTCSPGEKKYCEGRTCTCKPLDYCQQNDGDCQHKTCDASKAEVKVCLSGTCGCLAIPDFCGGDDTSTCQHIICNQYQVKKCENGMCKCQVNPSCNAKEGLNDTCTPENTYLEVKGTDGRSYYANCTDSFHYPLCVEDRCQCVYWKTPPPPLTSEGSTIPTSSMTDVSGSTVFSTVPSQTTEAMTDSSMPIPTDQPTGASQTTNQTTDSIPNTTETPVPSTTSAATCASRMDCNQQNTHATFLTFTMPCPVDHIDCVDNKCFCSIDKITTTPKPTTTTTAAPSISCHQCGDPDANLPCDLRTVYMGQPSQCLTGSYCMTDVVQGSDDSVAIYKRCVDELTCRNEWMAQSSDQDRCLRYGEGAVPGQYTCHYCCTVDGCNSKIVPEAKTFYSTSSSINNRK